ncbi:DUF3883 domain-containing protein [Flavobacterium sp. UBA6046]|jgi:hypothetical protein|uniref:DUF3883 domain-containing protein n=1 Tax=Flavobacterium sp. UBA6046 TaxID=1946552 RepID=UPI0025B84D2C|nr:DUF3883 domain-containing protein [Flavobacterium sp. UBA6046]
MFKELLNHNQIGTKIEIGYILFDVLRSDIFKGVDDIKIQCLHYSYSFGNCFNGTIFLLNTLNLIITENGSICRNPELDIYSQESFFETGFFFEKIIELLENNQQFANFFNSNTVKFSIEKASYYLRDSHLPIKHSTIKRILINTDLLVKDSIVRTIFYVNEKYVDVFNRLVINKMQLSALSWRKKRQLTLESLKKQQQQQEELGLQAELFVLCYEQSRLAKHPLILQINRISDEYSNAGYDIESFNDVDTILINRYIEVKSFSRSISFFWSINEIQIARDKQDEYFIYLVNRDEMELPGYCPLMISNPYKYIYENPDWKRDVGQYKFYLI